MPAPKPIEIAFDFTRARPGSPNVQMQYGGDPDAVREYFPEETWLTVFTPDMTLYPVTPDLMRQLAKVAQRIMRQTYTEGGSQ